MQLACMASIQPPRAAIVRASGAGLQPWQQARLRQAAAQGRRQVKVEKLCKELQLPRSAVLEYLKNNPAPPPAERNTSEGQDFGAGRPERGSREEWGSWQEPHSEQAAAAPRARQPRQDRQDREGEQGVPAWKRYDRLKGLGRQAEATLEMVYSRTQWPSDSVVESMWDLHRIRKEKVIEWFKARRLQDRQGQGRPRPGKDVQGIEWFTGNDE